MQRDTAVVDAISALERYAKVFDEISDETDARYSATSFVRWVKLEVGASRGEHLRADKPPVRRAA